ncbi:MAG: matrixin family metalloprotease [Thermoleophilaceae bacterium]
MTQRLLAGASPIAAARFTLALAAVALLMLAAAPRSQAYSIGGRAWPGGKVAYSAKGYTGAVERAARLINHSGAHVRLTRAPRASADVVVGYGGVRCSGLADMGFAGASRAHVDLGRGCNSALMTVVAVHEFTHVLGLDHENRRCARMNTAFDQTGTPSHCRRQSLAYWLAHPYTSDDLRGLRALYG